MANGGVIGNAVIEVTVDASRIRAGMESARSSTASSAAAVAGSTDQVGKAVKKQLSDFTGGVARVSTVMATFYTFLRLGQQIAEMLKSGTERARDFTDALDTRNATDALSKLNAEIGTIEARIDSATGTPTGYINNLLFGDTPDKMQRQLESLRRTASGLQQFENARTRSAESKRQDAAVASIKAQADAIVQAAGDGPDAIVARYAKQYRDATDLAKNARSQRERDAAAELASIVNNAMLTDLAQAKLDQQIKSLEERNKIAEEWAAIEAKGREQLEAQNAALKAQQNIVKQSSLDNTNRMVTGIDDLNQKLDAISQQMRRLQ